MKQMEILVIKILKIKNFFNGTNRLDIAEKRIRHLNTGQQFIQTETLRKKLKRKHNRERSMGQYQKFYI